MFTNYSTHVKPSQIHLTTTRNLPVEHKKRSQKPITDPMVFTTTSRGHQLQPKQTTIPPTTSRPTPKNSPMVSPDEHIAGAYYHVTTFDDFRPTLREYFITQVHVTKRTKQTKEKLTKADDNGFSSNDNDTIRVVGLWDPTPKVAN